MAEKFWRMEDPVMDEDGDVIMGGMFAHQREWWQLPNFIKAMVAGYGSGKTFAACKRAIAISLKNSGCPHLCISPSYKIAKRTSIPIIKALLDGKKSLDSSLRYKYNKTDHEFRIYHRGRRGIIWVASGDEPDSLKGPTVGSAWIDEPFVQDVEVLEQALARVRDPKAKQKEITLTGTPEELNWGYEICEGDRADDFDLGMIHAHTKENLALGTEYGERLERAFTDRMVDAYLGGQFVNLSRGAVYYGFRREINVKELPDPGHELEVGMDFNVDPMAAVVFWRNGNHVHIISEIEIENADTQYMCQILKEDNKDRHYVRGLQSFLDKDEKPRILNVYPDASGKSRSTKAPGGKSDFHFIREAGFELFTRSRNPRIRDRENAVNGKLRPQKGPITLTIDPCCKRLIHYMMSYTHEGRNKTASKAMSHLLDAMGYAVSYLFPIIRPEVSVGKVSGF